MIPHTSRCEHTSSGRSPITFRAKPGNPCPICASGHGCSATEDGLHFCRDAHNRGQHEAAGWLYFGPSKNPSFGLYRNADDFDRDRPRIFRPGVEEEPAPTSGDPARLAAWLDMLRGLMTELHKAPGALRSLANRLNIPEAGLRLLDGYFVENDTYNRAAYAFPLKDRTGHPVGYSIRSEAGDKKMAPGSSTRGLFVPIRQPKDSGPFYCPEGATDTATLLGMGLPAIGRFNNVAGAQELAEYARANLSRAEWFFVILGENDRKDDGRWPGRDGERVAQELANLLDVRVLFALTPGGIKDVRDWYADQMRRSKEEKHARTPSGLGSRFTENLHGTYKVFDPGKPLPPICGAPVQALGGDGAGEATPAHGPSMAEMVRNWERDHPDWRSPFRSPEGQAAAPALPPRPRECRRAPMRFRRKDNHLHRRESGLPCGSWSCPDCIVWKRLCVMARLRHHLGQVADGIVHIGDVVAPDWDLVNEHIKDQGGAYGRIGRRLTEDGLLSFVVSTVPFCGSCTCTVEEALERLALAVEAIPLGGFSGRHPVSFSHKWPDLEERREEPAEWEATERGLATTEEACAILAAHGIEFAPPRTSGAGEWQQGRTHVEYEIPAWWTREDILRFDERMREARLPRKGEDWTVRPRPEPAEPAEPPEPPENPFREFSQAAGFP